MEQPPTPRESERRHATVLFADMSGFTAMSERTDPEEVTAVVNHCFEILEQAVVNHGGHVDKYIGDCIMAVFGVPKALEHAPELAVRAAIDMVDRVRAFIKEQRLTAPLDLHVGINSGLVIAGEVGGARTREFTVMGDTVNLASRLKDAAANGAIWVGPQTYRYTRNVFEYETLKPLILKGKESPIPAYRVLAAKDRAIRTRHSPSEGMIFSGLVGRDRELAILRQHVAGLLEGQGGIVSLVGEAGLGKSRLLAELAELDEIRDMTLLRGTSLAIGRGLPFHPFVDLFRQWAGIGEAATDHVAVAQLEEAIAHVAPDDAGEIVPFLATLMGLRVTGVHAGRLQDIEGEAMEKLISKSVRDLLQRLANTRPLVLIFEDLHWADLSSIKLLESLLRLVQDTRVLFVHAFRPDDSGPGQGVQIVAPERYSSRHVVIELEPLSGKHCDTLVKNLLSLDDLPYATLGAILRKAEGNPFFIEEVIRSLIDEGAVEFRDNRFRVTEKLETVVIPGTIQEVIMGRIDRLPEAARRLLQIASVIGRSFHHRVVAHLLSQDEQLDLALAYLKKRQLIVERTSGVEIEYVFKHALAQETIYESILQKTRKEIHLAVACAIESLFGDRLPEFYGMLAYHFSRAESLERAEEYLFKAGDEAVHVAASSEALSYFQEASRLYMLIHGEGGDSAKKALLEKNIGMALLNKGNLAECIPHFDAALAHLGEPVPRSSVLFVLQSGVDMVAVLRYLYFTPRKHRVATDDWNAREAMEVRYNRAKAQTTTDTTRFFFDTIRSIRRLNHADPATVEGACGMYAGGAALFSFSGVSFRIGARFLRIAKKLVREGSVRDLVAYRTMQFIHHYLEGDWSDEYAIDIPLIEQGIRYGQLWDVSTYLGLNTERRLRQGDFSTARRQIAKLAELVDAYGSDFARSNLDGYRAFLLVEERKLDEAGPALQLYYTSRVEKLFNLLALGWIARHALAQGDQVRAVGALAEAETIIEGLGQVPAYHQGPYVTSRLLYDVNAFEEAVMTGRREQQTSLRRRAQRSARQGVRIALRVASERVETYRLVGRLHWILGRETKALRWWARSITEGERLGAWPELGRSHVEIGRRLALAKEAGPTPGGLDSGQHLDRARDMFTELGLAWDLEQLNRTCGAAADRRNTGAALTEDQRQVRA